MAVMVTGSPIVSPAGVRSWTVIGDVPFDFARTGMTTDGLVVRAQGDGVVAGVGGVGIGPTVGRSTRGTTAWATRRAGSPSSGSADVLATCTSMSPDRPVSVNVNGLGRHHRAADRVGFGLDLRGHGGGLVVVDRGRDQSAELDRPRDRAGDRRAGASTPALAALSAVESISSTRAASDGPASCRAARPATGSPARGLDVGASR